MYRFFEFLGDIRGAQITNHAFFTSTTASRPNSTVRKPQDLVRFVYAWKTMFTPHCRRQERKDTCRPMDLDTKAFSRSPAAR